jgi:DNA ligase-1
MTAQTMTQLVNASEQTTLYKSHANSVGYWNINVEMPDGGDEAYLVISHAKTLDGKATGSRVPVKGKNIGRANETTPWEQAMSEMASRIRKQEDKGYTLVKPEAGAQATNSLGLAKPMLATVWSKVKPESIDWANCFGQYKLDGHRAMYKDGVLYSRQGKEINLPHIKDQLEALENKLGYSLHLDGELYCHGTPLQQIGSLVKRPREESTQLVYHVYDCVKDMAYEHRLEMLKDYLSSEDIDGSFIRLLNTVKITSVAEAQQLQAQAIAAGYEGAILRHGTAGYEDDKRSRNLLKLKDYQDAEFTIVGVTKGSPRYLAAEDRWLEVAIWQMVTQDGKPVEATAPGDMYEKDRWWREGPNVVGKTATVKFFTLSDDGIPLQPVALGLREDI